MESLEASKHAFKKAALHQTARPKSLEEAKQDLLHIEKDLQLPPLAHHLDSGNVTEAGKELFFWMLRHEPQKLIINALITISTNFFFSRKK